MPGTFGHIELLFVLQTLVVTQRERILIETGRFIAANEARDFAVIREIISPVYESEGMDAKGITDFIESSLERLRVYDTRPHRRGVTVKGRRAEMILVARATVSAEGAAGLMHWGSWRINWRCEGDQWRITALRPTMIDGVEFDGLRTLAPHIPCFQSPPRSRRRKPPVRRSCCWPRVHRGRALVSRRRSRDHARNRGCA